MGATHGYRTRSPETWARARADYLSGFTAGEVCDRHGLGLSAVRARIRRENWNPEAIELDDDGPVPSPSSLVDLAWRRLTRAVRAGRATDALRWMRLHESLARMAAEEPAAGVEESDAPGHCADRPMPESEVHDVRIFFAEPAALAPDRAHPAQPPLETRARSP